MDIKNMMTFLKVADLKSFSKAADQLGYSQSAVSTQIIKLENELGKSLFDRIGHAIYLTEDGILFRQYVQNVLMLTENLESDFKKSTAMHGLIRIATSDSLCSSFFTDIFIKFQNKYPNIKLHIRSGVTDDMIKLLMQNEVDFVYTLDSKVHKPDLIVVNECPEKCFFYTSSSHPLSHLNKVKFSDIKKYPSYVTEEGISYRKLLDDKLAERHESINPSLETENVQVIRKLILNTNGIGFIPTFVVKRDLNEGSILPIKLNNLDVTVWRQLIHHKGKALTPAMNAFMSYICSN